MVINNLLLEFELYTKESFGSKLSFAFRRESVMIIGLRIRKRLRLRAQAYVIAFVLIALCIVIIACTCTSI